MSPACNLKTDSETTVGMVVYPVDGQLILDLEYKTDYGNTDSEAFKELNKLFCEEVKIIFLSIYLSLCLSM